jgi:hypothetical protein
MSPKFASAMLRCPEQGEKAPVVRVNVFRCGSQLLPLDGNQPSAPSQGHEVAGKMNKATAAGGDVAA